MWRLNPASLYSGSWIGFHTDVFSILSTENASIVYWLEWSVCSCLTQLILFDGRGVFKLLPKAQLHVSALNNSHLHVVHESLESSYTRFGMGCVQWGWDGQEISYVSWRLGGGYIDLTIINSYIHNSSYPMYSPPNLHDTYEISCPPRLPHPHCTQPILNLV
jgi:hypothetical protein